MKKAADLWWEELPKNGYRKDLIMKNDDSNFAKIGHWTQVSLSVLFHLPIYLFRIVAFCDSVF